MKIQHSFSCPPRHTHLGHSDCSRFSYRQLAVRKSNFLDIRHNILRHLKIFTITTIMHGSTNTWLPAVGIQHRLFGIFSTIIFEYKITKKCFYMTCRFQPSPSSLSIKMTNSIRKIEAHNESCLEKQHPFCKLTECALCQSKTPRAVWASFRNSHNKTARF